MVFDFEEESDGIYLSLSTMHHLFHLLTLYLQKKDIIILLRRRPGGAQREERKKKCALPFILQSIFLFSPDLTKNE